MIMFFTHFRPLLRALFVCLIHGFIDGIENFCKLFGQKPQKLPVMLVSKRARKPKGFRPQAVTNSIEFIISGLRADLDVDLS